MVNRILIIASVAAVISLTNGNSAPFITPCKSNDAECAKQNAVKAIPLFADGIKDLGVKPLDPLFFETVDCSSPNLKFILKDITLQGLKSCKPLVVRRDAPNSKLVVKLSCAVKLDGDYEINGQVLVLKISGKGKIHVYIRNVEIEALIDIIDKIGKDGKKHLRVKKFTHKHVLKDKSDVVFEGLFHDNEVLKQATEDLLKNSGNEIVDEIGGKMIQVTVTEVVQNVNNFFEIVPYDE